MVRHQATVNRTRILVEGISHSAEDDSAFHHSHSGSHSVVATEVAPNESRAAAVLITVHP